ncbi:MAG: hypothetical protein FJX69_14845 [Alphaproteobacteria bacterium]|nr:hypothetical protein [Alphaproteobacteria bacterium]
MERDDDATTTSGEPDLRDLLEDPMLHAVMRRDGLTRLDLDAAIAQARDRLRASAQAGSSSLSQ